MPDNPYHFRGHFHTIAGARQLLLDPGETISAGNRRLNAVAAATAGCLYGTLVAALAARKITGDAATVTATFAAQISGPGPGGDLLSLAVHYALSIPAESRAAAERALRVHARGCPLHQRLAGRFPITWDARLAIGAEMIILSSDGQRAGALAAT